MFLLNGRFYLFNKITFSLLIYLDLNRIFKTLSHLCFVLIFTFLLNYQNYNFPYIYLFSGYTKITTYLLTNQSLVTFTNIQKEVITAHRPPCLGCHKTDNARSLNILSPFTIFQACFVVLRFNRAYNIIQKNCQSFTYIIILTTAPFPLCHKASIWHPPPHFFFKHGEQFLAFLLSLLATISFLADGGNVLIMLLF